MESFPWDTTQPEPAPVSKKTEAILSSFESQMEDKPQSEIDPYYLGDIPEHIEPGLPNQFYLSQSLIKQLTDRHGMEKEFCPHKIYRTYVIKDVKTVRSEAMLEGSYGESLILGAVAKNEKVTDALRKHSGTGKMRVAQQRILMQVEAFRHIAAIRQINVIPGINVQVPVFKKFGNNVILRGEMDIFPTTIIWEDELCMAIVDIKFTADVNSTFGPYAWGDTEKIDYIQGDFYHYLVRDFDLELNIKHGHEFNSRVGYSNLFTDFVKKVIQNNDLKFIYMIFGYKKPDLSNQFLMINRNRLEKNESNIREKELEERIRKSVAILKHNHISGWEKRPLRDECKNCPLNVELGGDCKEPLKFKNV